MAECRMQISRDGSTSGLSQSSVTIPGALGPYLRVGYTKSVEFDVALAKGH